ncbi:MAG: CdaR family protein [Clostridia bacterium]|nr:CdaR family protein [Clostridia bacterium]
MSKGSQFFRSVLKALKNFATRNIGIKIVALLFAALLWGYIMADLNPIQPKTVSDVKITLEGTNDLLSRNLIVVDSETGTARVTINSNINNHSSLNANRVLCVASVATINEAGTYELMLDATVQNDLGTVDSVSPSTVTVEVDNLVSKNIPVRLTLAGDVAEGYEIVSQTISNSIIVEGAERYIAPIAWAEAVVDVSGMTSDFESAVTVSFYDRAGESLEVITRSSDEPSVVVQLGILAVKEDVPIRLVLSEYDEYYYEVISSITFDTVDLLGDKDILDSIDYITTVEVPITEDMLDSTVTRNYNLNIPDGVQLRAGQQRSVGVTITVKDAEDEMEVEIPIESVGLDKDIMLSTDSPTYITIMVKGKVRELEQLVVSDFTAIADFTGRGVGTHEIVVTAEYGGKLEIVLVRDTERCSFTLVSYAE